MMDELATFLLWACTVAILSLAVSLHHENIFIEDFMVAVIPLFSTQISIAVGYLIVRK